MYEYPRLVVNEGKWKKKKKVLVKLEGDLQPPTDFRIDLDLWPCEAKKKKRGFLIDRLIEPPVSFEPFAMFIHRFLVQRLKFPRATYLQTLKYIQ